MFAIENTPSLPSTSSSPQEVPVVSSLVCDSVFTMEDNFLLTTTSSPQEVPVVSSLVCDSVFTMEDNFLLTTTSSPQEVPVVSSLVCDSVFTLEDNFLLTTTSSPQEVPKNTKKPNRKRKSASSSKSKAKKKKDASLGEGENSSGEHQIVSPLACSVFNMEDNFLLPSTSSSQQEVPENKTKQKAKPKSSKGKGKKKKEANLGDGENVSSEHQVLCCLTFDRKARKKKGDNTPEDPYARVKRSKSKKLKGLPLDKAEQLRLKMNEQERNRQRAIREAIDELKQMDIPDFLSVDNYKLQCDSQQQQLQSDQQQVILEQPQIQPETQQILPNLQQPQLLFNPQQHKEMHHHQQQSSLQQYQQQPDTIVEQQITLSENYHQQIPQQLPSTKHQPLQPQQQQHISSQFNSKQPDVQPQIPVLLHQQQTHQGQSLLPSINPSCFPSHLSAPTSSLTPMNSASFNHAPRSVGSNGQNSSMYQGQYQHWGVNHFQQPVFAPQYYPVPMYWGPNGQPLGHVSVGPDVHLMNQGQSSKKKPSRKASPTFSDTTSAFFLPTADQSASGSTPSDSGYSSRSLSRGSDIGVDYANNKDQNSDTEKTDWLLDAASVNQFFENLDK
ncbi:mediator of RNA polymerase II transcription subunit 15 [Biomphalaria glabrata]|nr:mediator of RNA polymerase II transcription subunit 15 [Biomphalaria glabrata]